MPFGGFAFFSLVSDSKSIVGFEASFEYGAVVAFSFGPLEAVGSVTTGIYVARLNDSAMISGYFQASGAAHIACFGVYSSLIVSVEQGDGGALRGSATYTFGFSLGFLEYKFEVGVSRSIAKGWTSGNSVSGQALYRHFAGRLSNQLAATCITGHEADLILATVNRVGDDALKQYLMTPPPPSPAPIIRCTTVLMSDDWDGYTSYFDGDL